MALEADQEAPLHAVAAEFSSGDALIEGMRALLPKGLGRLDAHSPVPLVGLADAIESRGPSLPLIGIAAAVLAFAASMTLCIYATAFDYRFDIGGRPRVSWPAFVVPSLSFAMMAGALAVYLVMLFLNRLPRLNHPVFNIERFTRVSQDGYFLVVEEGDGPLDAGAVEAAFAALPHRPTSIQRARR